MLPFVQSAFLRSLGHAIANSLWQVALIWLLYMLLNTVFRFTAAARYRLGLVAQFAGFVWFVATCRMQYSSSSLSPSADAGMYAGQVSAWLAKSVGALPYISITYLLLISLLAVRWMMGYRHTQMMRTEGLQKIPVEWKLFIKRISSQLYINKEIRVFLSEHIATPLTIGFLKPVILVPVASINHLTTAQLEAVLLHELAHIKRHDYLLNMIVSVIELVLFFNPFTHLLGKTIRKERENSCDDWVLQFQYNASEYAEALLRIASLQTTPVFAMAASGRKKELLLRVRRMIGQAESRAAYRKQVFAFFLVTVMLAGIAWLSPAGNAAKKDIAVSVINVPQLQKTFTVQQVSFHTTPMPATVAVPKKIKLKEPIIHVPDISLLPVKAPESLEIASAVIEQREELLPLKRQLSYDMNIDRLVANINNLDIEKTMTDILANVQLSDEDKKELSKIRKLVLSERDRELMKKELTKKQQIRLQNVVTVRNEDNTNRGMTTKTATPLIIKISFTIPDDVDADDAKQVARIKLAILRQLNFVLVNKEKRDQELGTRN